MFSQLKLFLIHYDVNKQMISSLLKIKYLHPLDRKKCQSHSLEASLAFELFNNSMHFINGIGYLEELGCQISSILK